MVLLLYLVYLLGNRIYRFTYLLMFVLPVLSFFVVKLWSMIFSYQMEKMPASARNLEGFINGKCNDDSSEMDNFRHHVDDIFQKVDKVYYVVKVEKIAGAAIES